MGCNSWNNVWGNPYNSWNSPYYSNYGWNSYYPGYYRYNNYGYGNNNYNYRPQPSQSNVALPQRRLPRPNRDQYNSPNSGTVFNNPPSYNNGNRGNTGGNNGGNNGSNNSGNINSGSHTSWDNSGGGRPNTPDLSPSNNTNTTSSPPANNNRSGANHRGGRF